jgi:hypothetical protein
MPEFIGFKNPKFDREGYQQECKQESLKDPWLLLVEVSLDKMRDHIAALEKEAKSIELLLDAHRRRLY